MTRPLIDRNRVEPQRRRVLLKLSGEVFGGGQVGLDTAVVRRIAEPDRGNRWPDRNLDRCGRWQFISTRLDSPKRDGSLARGLWACWVP